ncbi:hypothetical protein ABZU32_08850 [Sphaerisporangium sp. NPDC005288]|uniref:hypothetical protein n=1 Tax=Sphaerisporangium sp. NPDC005288 TaxID=3155114 RepID=UPI0033B2DA8E
MSITPIPAPDPDEVARGLAELELYVAKQTPAAPAGPTDAGQGGEQIGETERVRELRAQVAEAHRLVELQEDEAPLLVDTPTVRKRRVRVAEAARLHELANDPAALAYRDQKVRRTTTFMVMSAAGIALAVSSIGVQASVATALKLDDKSIGWWAAFGVEPALSLPLLAAVGVQAYSAMRGRVVDRDSPAGKRLFWTELLLLGLTLVLNCWPAFSGVWNGFDLLPLIVHSLGPVAAVVAVWTLPTLWSVLAALPTGAPTSPTYRANVAALVVRVRELIAAGELPANPSASRIQRTLRCGMDDARAVRDALAGGA